QFRDVLLLEGKVDDPVARTRAETIARAYAKDVVDLIKVDDAQPAAKPVDLATQVAQAIGDPSVRVRVVGDTVFLEGTVPSAFAQHRAEALAKAFAHPVISLLQIGAPAPVLVPAAAAAAAESEAGSAGAANAEAQSAAAAGGATAGETSTANGAAATEAGTAAGASTTTASAVVGPPAGQAAAEPGRSDLAALIAQTIGDPRIHVRLVNDTVFLEGKLDDDHDKLRADALAKAYNHPVVDLIEVAPTAAAKDAPVAAVEDPVQVVQQIQKAIGDDRIHLRIVGRTLFMEGTVASDFDQRRADALAKAFGLPVVDLIQVQPSPAPASAPSGNASPASASPPVAAVDPKAVAEAQLKALTEAIGPTSAHLWLANGRLVIDGHVDTAAEHDRVLKLAVLYFPNPVDLLGVGQAVDASGALVRQIQGLIEDDGVKVSASGGKVLLQGHVPTPVEHQKVVGIAAAFAGKDAVVDLLTVDQTVQVLIKVKALEINKNDAKDLGLSWGADLRGVLDQNQLHFMEPAIPGGPWQRDLLMTQIDALTNKGDARTLAAPSLLTVSGKTADFMAGGQIPVAIPQSDKTTVEWKDYGVQLHVTPVVHDDETISLDVNPVVSTLDWANGVRVSGALLPALKVRQTSTSVVLHDGESLAIGGLFQSDQSKQVTSVPLLGSLPVIGALFKSTKWTNNETELVFVISPELVRGTTTVAQAVSGADDLAKDPAVAPESR
ncbi:MAG TPA: BON domain-containing protein, partial [Limnochordia bacterium]|nr:BON domain-containing protein [Limnochordia bacterium]